MHKIVSKVEIYNQKAHQHFTVMFDALLEEKLPLKVEGEDRSATNGK